MQDTAVLLIQCPDKKGIVAKVSGWALQHNCNIVRSHQYSTNATDGRFFMRLELSFSADELDFETLKKRFAEVAAVLQADWQCHQGSYKPRLGILVSHYDHCLFDLLYHWRCGDLVAEIPYIASNHKDCESLAQQYGIPFHYLPVSGDTKAIQEKQLLSLLKDETDFLVLARYMQILSGDFLQSYGKDIINIHHSFLPSFAGARPYAQAYARGVKVIGATAHFVTEDLDEGPIISQIVESVSHCDSTDDLQRKGKNLEKRALLRAVEAYVQHRVLRFGNKTIVFDE